MNCQGCQKAIYQTDPKFELKGAFYHVSCVKCSVCKSVLSTANFFSADNQIFCKQHYDELMRGTLGGDKKFIHETSGSESSSSAAATTTTTESANKPAASSEPKPAPKWGKIETTKCGGCGKTIYPRDPQFSVGGNLYHSSCCKCDQCGMTLSALTVQTDSNKKPLCKPHWQERMRTEGHHLFQQQPQQQQQQQQQDQQPASQ